MKYLRIALGALSCLALGAAATGGLSTSWAQDKYPVKPVKIVVPYGPGGATDIVTRIVAEQMRQSLGQSFVVENKPGAFGIVAIQEMMNAQARRLHADDRQRLDQRDHAGDRAGAAEDQLQPRRRAGDQPDRHSGVPGGDHHQLLGEGRHGADRLRQEEPRQDALRHRRRRQLSALRHGVLRQARRRSRHGRDPQQAGRRRHHQRHADRRRAGRVPQRRVDRGADQGRQAPADRGGQSDAAAGLSGRADHEGGRLPGRRHHRLERHVRAGGDAASGARNPAPRDASRR